MHERVLPPFKLMILLLVTFAAAHPLQLEEIDPISDADLKVHDWLEPLEESHDLLDLQELLWSGETEDSSVNEDDDEQEDDQLEDKQDDQVLPYMRGSVGVIVSARFAANMNWHEQKVRNYMMQNKVVCSPQVIQRLNAIFKNRLIDFTKLVDSKISLYTHSAQVQYGMRYGDRADVWGPIRAYLQNWQRGSRVDLCTSFWTHLNTETKGMAAKNQCSLGMILGNPCAYSVACAYSTAWMVGINDQVGPGNKLSFPAEMAATARQIATVSCADAMLSLYEYWRDAGYWKCRCPHHAFADALLLASYSTQSGGGVPPCGDRQ